MITICLFLTVCYYFNIGRVLDLFNSPDEINKGNLILLKGQYFNTSNKYCI